ncbi:MAG: acyloxyacyl hydrolase [Deltaproteobacteria bacterium]|nr:acyloxyacyl hydrolase [Deltaproteobacteria bacterium]
MKKLFISCCVGVVLCLPLTAGAAETTTVYTEQTAYEITTQTRPDKEGLGIYVAPKLVWSYTVFDKLKGEADITNGGEYGGISKKSRKDDDTWGGAIAVGYDFERLLNVPMRGEIEYAFFGNVDGSVSRSFDGGTVSGEAKLKNKMDIQTLFFNAYFDFDTDTPFTPYLGAGLGIAFVDSKSSGSVDYSVGGVDYSGSSSTNYKLNTNFAWNVGAGVAWEFNDLLTLDLGYRFASLGKVKSRSSSYEGVGETVSYKSKVTDVYMHQVMMGLRFTF